MQVSAVAAFCGFDDTRPLGVQSAAAPVGRVTRVPSQDASRLLFVHTLFNGVTIAHDAARAPTSASSHLRWARRARSTASAGRGSPSIRPTSSAATGSAKLTAALKALGIGGPIYLGGAGRWRDSGMPGTPPRHRTRFVDADTGDVVTYDPNGGLRTSRPHPHP